MGARLRVFLTREQDKTLLNLRKEDVPNKVKDRAEVVRLNAHGWYVEKIADHFGWTTSGAECAAGAPAPLKFRCVCPDLK